MSEKRFKLDFDNCSQGCIMDRQDKYGQYCKLYDFGKVGRQQIVDLLNYQDRLIEEQHDEIINWTKKYVGIKKENERLRNQLERKTILLKIRTKHIDDREKSFHELLNYLESFCYKSNIDGNYAKQDIINILNNWEIREYD